MSHSVSPPRRIGTDGTEVLLWGVVLPDTYTISVLPGQTLITLRGEKKKKVGRSTVDMHM